MPVKKFETYYFKEQHYHLPFEIKGSRTFPVFLCHRDFYQLNNELKSMYIVALTKKQTVGTVCKTTGEQRDWKAWKKLWKTYLSQKKTFSNYHKN